jgi:aminoglycoside 3-N-acetyltransferase
MKDKIINDLKNLGIKPADTLLVHSSLKSMGGVEGGPVTVIEALIDAVSEGTLLLPALSYENVGMHSDKPRYLTDYTPSNVGIIPETFRKYPGVIRSMHPTHSVCAIGKDAVRLTENHYLDRTPVGEHSPFRLLVKYKGKILMLGCGLAPNTFMHGVEEAVGTPYVLSDKKICYEIVYADGSADKIFHTPHDFKDTTQRYERLENLMDMQKGKVLSADAYVMDACVLWETASAMMKKDPLYFIEKRA